MKQLTNKEFISAPPIVQYLYSTCLFKIPVGSKMIDDAILLHPEYFPDEVEYRRKWNLIPQEVHDLYLHEKNELNAGDKKEGEMFSEWIDRYIHRSEEMKSLEKQLHQKHYGKYGIEYNGF